jgi:hypothetical protein
VVSLTEDFTLALDRVTFAGKLGITPDTWQADLLRSEASRMLLNCSRQSGKSTISGVLALHRALYYPGSLVLVLAPSERQSKELFAKVAGFYRELGRPVPAQGERKLSLELANGSRIITLPGTEKTIRGFSGAALLLVDEAARVDDALYHAVRPMLAVSRGRLLMLSTPFGKRGAFYEEWTNGASGASSGAWERFRMTADECPRIPEAFLEEERASKPGWVYRQEYECSFEETEDQVFTTEMVESAVTSAVKPLFGGG